MKITKKRYLQGFLAVTLVLAVVRCVFPSVARDREAVGMAPDAEKTAGPREGVGNERQVPEGTGVMSNPEPARSHGAANSRSRFFKADGTPVKNKIFSVPGYSKSFPDMQDVQYAAATKWGVSPVANRGDAESRKSELVYVAGSPYFHVDKLNNSIPYLVPRAANLLHDIGTNFFDSLQMKGVPLHKLIVTSVLRTKEDITKLRGHNGNATENSCHLYGTTFDVCYNRYKTVEAPGEKRRQVRNDSLKYILAEVLRDMRESGRCYVKYEVKQGCFHITVR